MNEGSSQPSRMGRPPISTTVLRRCAAVTPGISSFGEKESAKVRTFANKGTSRDRNSAMRGASDRSIQRILPRIRLAGCRARPSAGWTSLGRATRRNKPGDRSGRAGRRALSEEVAQGYLCRPTPCERIVAPRASTARFPRLRFRKSQPAGWKPDHREEWRAPCWCRKHEDELLRRYGQPLLQGHTPASLLRSVIDS